MSWRISMLVALGVPLLLNAEPASARYQREHPMMPGAAQEQMTPGMMPGPTPGAAPSYAALPSAIPLTSTQLAHYRGIGLSDRAIV